MLYYVKLTERTSQDPQEERQLALIRRESIRWLNSQASMNRYHYIFRSEDNKHTHIFLDAPNHQYLHDNIDPDPLISYCHIDIEPLLTPTEMARSLEQYLLTKVLTEKDWDELSFEIQPVDEDCSYYLARKVIQPFSSLLSIEQQNHIHMNTLRSQTAHGDDREIADYNPVAKPVGILIMKANSIEEVEKHVMGCEVYIDTQVEIVRLLTLSQAEDKNNCLLDKYLIGDFRKEP